MRKRLAQRAVDVKLFLKFVECLRAARGGVM